MFQWLIIDYSKDEQITKGVTMLRNTRKELPYMLRVPRMEQLVKTMMKFQRGVIESAVTCYEQQLAASNKGENPVIGPGPGRALLGQGRR